MPRAGLGRGANGVDAKLGGERGNVVVGIKRHVGHPLLSPVGRSAPTVVGARSHLAACANERWTNGSPVRPRCGQRPRLAGSWGSAVSVVTSAASAAVGERLRM